MKNKRRTLANLFINSPYVFWAAAFIIIPLIVVLFYAFTDGHGHFTVQNMASLKDYGPVILRSLWYSALATVITLVIAYPFAYTVCRLRPMSRKLANMFITLPMWINLLIKTYCLTSLMESNGLINQALTAIGFGRLNLMNNTGAVIFGMVYNYLPYMILPIYNVMTKIDPSLLEAAEDLGCNQFQRIRRVMMPLTAPGVISGIIMVFVPSVSTFYISAKMGGTGNFMIGDLIESQIHNQNSNLPVAAALSTVLMAIILVSMLILNKFSDSEEGGGVLI